MDETPIRPAGNTWRRLVATLIVIVGMPLAVAAVLVPVARAEERLAVAVTYGDGAYNHGGIRVVKRDGHLQFTTGESLPPWYHALLAGNLVPIALVIMAIYIIATRVAGEDLFGIHGLRRRPPDPRPLPPPLPPRFRAVAANLDDGNHSARK